MNTQDLQKLLTLLGHYDYFIYNLDRYGCKVTKKNKERIITALKEFGLERKEAFFVYNKIIDEDFNL